jgi:hypothetical protein
VEHPTKEQIAKLPKWAQRYIHQVENQRDNSRKALNKFEDTQTPSNVWTEEFVFDGGRDGDRHETRKTFFQTERVIFYHLGVRLEINVRDNQGIFLSWGAESTHGIGDVCFVPVAYQQARISNPVYHESDLQRMRKQRDRHEKEAKQ